MILDLKRMRHDAQKKIKRDEHISNAVSPYYASIARDDTSGYLRSACSSRYSIHLFRKPLPFLTVSESPITVSDRFGRVMATATHISD